MANSLAVWRNWLNQRRLTTGQNPTPEELQALRMAELEEAYAQKARNRQLAIQERSVANAEQATANQYNLGQRGLENQWSLGQQQVRAAKQAAADQKMTALIGTGVQLPLATYTGYKILKDTFGKPVNPQQNLETGNTVIGGIPQARGAFPIPDYDPTYEPGPYSTGNAEAANTIGGTAENIPGMNAPDMWADYTPPPDATGAIPPDLASVYEGGLPAEIGAAGAPAAAEATGTMAADAIAGTWAGAEVPAYEAGVAAAGGPNMWASANPYLAGVAAAYALDQTLNEGRVTNTVVEGANDLFDESKRTWENISDTVGEPVMDAISGVGAITSDVGKAIISPITGGGGTVICTELHRQGLMNDELYATESKFGQSLPHEAMDGYRRWANSIVKAMRKSKLATALTYALTYHVIREMAHRVDPEKYPDSPVIGRLYLKFGVPMCMWLGRDKPVPAIEGMEVS